MSADARAPRLLRGERVSMARTAKMELLRALVSERLSAAAEEIFRIVEGTIVEYENEMSCSTWVVDSHRRLLDVTKSHGEGQLIRRKSRRGSMSEGSTEVIIVLTLLMPSGQFDPIQCLMSVFFR